MNTLRDTDESKARPSVWPVYVAAGVITLGSVLYVISVITWPLVLFGSVTILGIVRLRPWGWWCGVVWTGLFTILLLTQEWAGEATFAGYDFLPFSAALPFLLVWSLATRRQLFFSPKQEGEE